MNIQFSLVDIIISIVVLVIYFVIYYFPFNKYYKKLQNPVQAIKQNIKISRFLLIFILSYIVIYYSICIYGYFDYEKEMGTPYMIKFFPLTFLFFVFTSRKSKRKALKDLEKDN
ncbi:MAG: hypothetical protein M0P32_08755 [Bacteroidales bacterium]|nr:hypothetical protein [Bacteroidales bacterium]